MKVKQLIEELSKFDQNLEVFTSDAEWGYFLVSTPKLIKNFEINTDPFSSDPAKKIKKGIIL